MGVCFLAFLFFFVRSDLHTFFGLLNSFFPFVFDSCLFLSFSGFFVTLQDWGSAQKVGFVETRHLACEQRWTLAVSCALGGESAAKGPGRAGAQ